MAQPQKHTPPKKRKVRVPWADHVLNGVQRRTVAKRMKLPPLPVKK